MLFMVKNKMKKRGPKIKKLNKKQKLLLIDIVETYLYWKESKKELQKLFNRARKLKIPITQLGKLIGVSKVSVLSRYKRSAKDGQ